MPTRDGDIGLGLASVLDMQFIGFFMFLDFFFTNYAVFVF
jgi:hypothetical protein